MNYKFNGNVNSSKSTRKRSGYFFAYFDVIFRTFVKYNFIVIEKVVKYNRCLVISSSKVFFETTEISASLYGVSLKILRKNT